MDLRRTLLVTALLLFGLALLSAATSDDEASTARKPPPSRVTSPPARTAGVIAPAREGAATPRVQARVGDLVTLEVRTRAPELVELAELGLDAPAEPGLPARFELLADRAGRFPVRSAVDGRTLGVLLVTASGPARRGRG
jgi:hypothetical protein